MKTKNFLILSLLAITTGIIHANPDERPKMNGKLRVTTLSPEEIRYTGKPYIKELGAYAFNFRYFDPEINRWTTVDPSGFPDGANNYRYVPNPVGQMDVDGRRITSLSGILATATSGDNTYTEKVDFKITSTPDNMNSTPTFVGLSSSPAFPSEFVFSNAAVTVDPDTIQPGTYNIGNKTYSYFSFSAQLAATLTVTRVDSPLFVALCQILGISFPVNQNTMTTTIDTSNLPFKTAGIPVE